MKSKTNQAKELILMLEKVTGRRVILREANEASRNLATEALDALSESLEMANQNLLMAIEKVKDLGSDGVSITKLQGMQSMLDANITQVSEIITSVTGMQTKEDVLAGDGMIEESLGDDENGVEMNMDDALQKPDNVKKFTDKGMNVILQDENV